MENYREEIYALRGATTVKSDSILEVDDAVGELMEELYKENSITDADLAFVVFSQTNDIKTRNAAAASRRAGFTEKVPIFCVQEADIAGGLKLCIRVLAVINHKRENEPKMVYLREARKLRPDWSKE